MSNVADPRIETTDLGVVDPMGIPGWMRRGLDRVPGLARAFVLFAIIDVVARIIGLIEPQIVFLPDAPLAIVTDFLPRTLWILLPAILLVRSPDAARSTPWVFRGAVVLALTTLVVEPLRSLVTRVLFDASFSGMYPIEGLALNATISILLIAAWLMLAKGFEELRPRPATPAGFALASLIALGFLLQAALVIFQILRTQDDAELVPGGPLTTAVMNILAALQGLATAYALWVIVRGLGDPGRPVRATRVAVGAATLWASAAFLVTVGSAWFLATQPAFDDPGLATATGLLGLLAWLAVVVAPTLLVLAFAMGVADPDLPAGRMRQGAEQA